MSQAAVFAPSTQKKNSAPQQAVRLGLLVSSWADKSVAAALSDSDRKKLLKAEERALNAPTGQEVTWNNPHTGNAGAIIPVHDKYAETGVYCRDFQQTVTAGPMRWNKGSTACQQVDGTWVVQSVF